MKSIFDFAQAEACATFQNSIFSNPKTCLFAQQPAADKAKSQ
jgi:hypothetical protein